MLRRAALPSSLLWKLTQMVSWNHKVSWIDANQATKNIPISLWQRPSLQATARICSRKSLTTPSENTCCLHHAHLAHQPLPCRSTNSWTPLRCSFVQRQQTCWAPAQMMGQIHRFSLVICLSWYSHLSSNHALKPQLPKWVILSLLSDWMVKQLQSK